MNLYSRKQKWKIALLIFALMLVSLSLFVSNKIVSKVGERERERATQWADAIKKKIELVQLTNNTFSKLREREREKMKLWINATKEVSKPTPLNQVTNYAFPLKIIQENTDIPVILLDNNKKHSGNINLDFDTNTIGAQYSELKKEDILSVFEDSLVKLAQKWAEKNPPFTIEVYDNLFMTYYYNDSKEITRLEAERDSLINAFNNDLINNDNLVSVILVDNETKEIIGTNIKNYKISESNISIHIEKLKNQNNPIIIDFKNGNSSTLYFDNSPELKQLKYFPYIQFLVIGLFAIIGYLIFSTFRKAEQNKVWAGMAKETAHQLGTPLSSLIAWVSILENKGIDKMITIEMQKDIDRLEKVTDRFSKIGSEAKLEDTDISKTINNLINYLRPRISDKIEVIFKPNNNLSTLHNASLIEWVIENITKNAIDAMEGEGVLNINLKQSSGWVHIDIKDNGRGISSKQIKNIFEPGFSTKKRGWGLGLSLVKRIIKEYHKGQVYVLVSEQNIGTTFRISLPSNIL